MGLALGFTWLLFDMHDLTVAEIVNLICEPGVSI